VKRQKLYRKSAKIENIIIFLEENLLPGAGKEIVLAAMMGEA